MGFFRYYNTFSYSFELNISFRHFLKEEIEQKTYFPKLGSNPQKYYIFRAEIFRLFFGSSEKSNKSFQNQLTFTLNRNRNVSSLLLLSLYSPNNQLGFRGPRPHMFSLVAYLLSTCLPPACLTGVWVLNFASVL